VATSTKGAGLGVDPRGERVRQSSLARDDRSMRSPGYRRKERHQAEDSVGSQKSWERSEAAALHLGAHRIDARHRVAAKHSLIRPV